MFDKERFHNALALSLGYERIINDKRITIEVDDSDEPYVTLKFQGCSKFIRIKAYGDSDVTLSAETSELRDDIKVIVDALHQAYMEAKKPF